MSETPETIEPMEEAEVANIQFNRKSGVVERDGTTGNAIETAVTGDADSNEAVTKMTGKFRVDSGTLDGDPVTKRDQIEKIREDAERRGAELVGVYGATAEEKDVLRSVMNKGVKVSLVRDSATDLKAETVTEIAA